MREYWQQKYLEGYDVKSADGSLILHAGFQFCYVFLGFPGFPLTCSACCLVNGKWQQLRNWIGRMADKFLHFCNSTALHGWPHLPNASFLGKVFWAVTILTSLLLAFFLSSRWMLQQYLNFHFSSTLTMYQEATVSTTLVSKTTPVEKANFPKIVICNKYKLRWGVNSNSKWRFFYLWFSGNQLWTLSPLLCWISRMIPSHAKKWPVQSIMKLYQAGDTFLHHR